MEEIGLVTPIPGHWYMYVCQPCQEMLTSRRKDKTPCIERIVLLMSSRQICFYKLYVWDPAGNMHITYILLRYHTIMQIKYMDAWTHNLDSTWIALITLNWKIWWSISVLKLTLIDHNIFQRIYTKARQCSYIGTCVHANTTVKRKRQTETWKSQTERRRDRQTDGTGYENTLQSEVGKG